MTDLDRETGEDVTYNKWIDILNDEFTLDRLTEFISNQIQELNKELIELVRDGKERQALYTTARLENYQSLHAMITMPDRNRQMLEEHLKELLAKPK